MRVSLERIINIVASLSNVMMTKHLLKSTIGRDYCVTAKNSIPEGQVLWNIIKLKNYTECIDLAQQLLGQGEVIAIPTDTIYGLAVDANNSDAVEKLYNIKGRSHDKPLAICVSNHADIHKWCDTRRIPPYLLVELLPGPVTVILERTKDLNCRINPGLSKIALRMPKNDFVLKLLSSLDNPLALTSANVSNEESTTSVVEFESLWSKLSAIFDGGIIGDCKKGSTIVDLTVSGKYKIIREGGYLEQTINILENHLLTSQT